MTHVRPALPLALLMVGLTLVGCDDQAEESAEPTEFEQLQEEGEEFGRQLDEVLEQQQEQAERQTEDIAEGGREALVTQADQRLVELDARMDRLRERAESAEAELGEPWSEIERDMDQSLADARDAVAEVREAGRATWEEAADDLALAMAKVRQTAERAETHLREQADEEMPAGG
ncbi:MAG: hypothetical protein ACLFV3_10545 [Phycisphaeraceae bacterium]